MNEIAVFSVEVADELIRRGYEVRGETDLAWFFDDNEAVVAAVNEIVANIIR